MAAQVSVLSRLADRVRNAVRETHARWQSPFGGAKFEQRAPAHANALELFSGRWATDLSQLDPSWSGGVAQLATDPRPLLAAQHLGTDDRLDGMSVLELGPLEGMHTYRFEQLGAARILAIESNVEAYLKCLIVKEAMRMTHSSFMLGDFNLYLQDTQERFDMVFACGVLYHMEEPLALIRGIARTTDRCFVWTHYVDENSAAGRIAVPAALDGITTTYYRWRYHDRAQPGFWGGNKPSASWMRRDDILAAFRHFGLNEIEVVGEDPNSLHGPTIIFAARRSKN
jgi:hypothetical protein